MKEATCSSHGNTINQLAKEGKIDPVTVVVGKKKVEFNSAWAASDWMEKNFPKNERPVMPMLTRGVKIK